MRSSVACVLALLCAPGARAQARLDLTRPDDALKAQQKMTCSLEDGKTLVYWWKGGAFSRMPGERDRHLFDVEGFNIRQCKSFSDPKRGHGYRSVSREIMLYLDPETGAILRQWKNPWTGAELDVVHVANDPVNMSRPAYAISEDGKPFKFGGTILKGRVWTSGEAPLFYKNPLGGEFQEYVGGSYHAIEMLSSFAYEQDLLDATRPTLQDETLSWARVSDWLPWMEMGDHPGMMVFTTVGKRVKGFEELPDVLKNEVRASYPAYTQPPPADDDRPNETSWSYFKKVVDAKKKASAQEGR